ncbi:response regulator [Myxococcus sp. MISCRS1]|jgi:CheY-like chemotaxis protein|uniref:response regulator n=1 Tax=Myxococcus TaxID=32 RepID=UPI001CBE87A9|nr:MULTISPECIES: response regulator [unclassified Myxococcus]MBZ4399021.1 response regulator [Myxococcus sp. AS-1-15]MBZ4413382.1 response regulator [Myxococcus sp. XM-1-1-1]MCY0999515.1 response regulator [Myxococcus sp. MISCRS1]BDT38672.1 response regulator [Myxococcus sp. MH1]
MTTLRKVMLVDDEEDIRAIGRLSLSRVGKWDTVLAASGAEALSKAAEELPDLILLDVMMPGMDGPTTFGELRKQAATSSTPIIFMTAKVQKQEVERYLGLGAVGVISKPFDPMTLPKEIRKLVPE